MLMSHRMRKLGQAGCAAAGLMIAMVILGCGEEKAPTTAPAADEKPATTTPAASAAPTAGVTAMLAKADAVDGKTDKVVSKCPGCGLAMDGDPAHASTVGDYKVHLCSADCKKAFDGDPSKVVLALEIPEKTE